MRNWDLKIVVLLQRKNKVFCSSLTSSSKHGCLMKTKLITSSRWKILLRRWRQATSLESLIEYLFFLQNWSRKGSDEIESYLFIICRMLRGSKVNPLIAIIREATITLFPCAELGLVAFIHDFNLILTTILWGKYSYYRNFTKN